MKKHQVLTTKQMEKVIGGYSKKDCLSDIGFNTLEYAITGGISGTAFGVGIGNAAGAFVGAHVGAIRGSLVCMGNMLIG